MIWEPEFFQPLKFTPRQLANYLSSAKRDLTIASQTKVPEVIFQFSYNALIKYGLYLIAGHGHRVRSAVGHHIKTIEKMAEITKNEEILLVGNQMRKSRNAGFYEGEELITEADARHYLTFVEKVIGKGDRLI